MLDFLVSTEDINVDREDCCLKYKNNPAELLERGEILFLYIKNICRIGENKMIDLLQLQKRVYQNKVAKGFNVTDIFQEFCFIYGELSEACEAYLKKKDDLGEELADVALYLIGLSELLGINLEEEIIHKMEKNEKRIYENKDGVLTKVKE
ncbi:MazG-like family protein [Paenibacillus sp. FSL H8-0259]|jgi:NTP pyrophosphatase (non-canonical NTP hydrolase)|uniref:MazG-like family protein n=2 Tax=Paenibacillus TaxID=44249 RepID=UPI001C4C026D|nr:MazG-like family protein [Paenibacillus sp. FSL H8-0259]